MSRRTLLDAVVPLLPGAAEICLMADRFYGTADQIALCQENNWDYRIRLNRSFHLGLLQYLD